jgi:hypothetical protein
MRFAPFEWDLKRLAASFVVAARWRGFTDDKGNPTFLAFGGDTATSATHGPNVTSLSGAPRPLVMLELLSEAAQSRDADLAPGGFQQHRRSKELVVRTLARHESPMPPVAIVARGSSV